MPAKKSKLAQIKTKETTASVEDFIHSVQDEQKQKDSFALVTMMKKASKQEPRMWGGSIIGFGNKRYKSPTSGREVDWFLIGFSPRKANLSLYLMMDNKKHAAVIQKSGKFKTSGGCIYLNRLEDVYEKVLRGVLKASFDLVKAD